MVDKWQMLLSWLLCFSFGWKNSLMSLQSPVSQCLSALSSTWCKGGTDAAQVSLLFSNWCSCHFQAQHQRHLLGRICALMGELVLECGQLYWWFIAILWHQKAFAVLTNKNQVSSLAQFCPAPFRYLYTGVVIRCAHCACDTKGTCSKSPNTHRGLLFWHFFRAYEN